MEQNPTILIIDALTNKTIEREMTSEEQTEHEALYKATQAFQTAQENKKLAHESALAKLAKLGLSADEIAAL